MHDVWTEGTMDEYTASMSRLSNETEKKCEVINIAPHVSVGAHSLKKADIIVISDKDEDEKDIKERFSKNSCLRVQKLIFRLKMQICPGYLHLVRTLRNASAAEAITDITELLHHLNVIFMLLITVICM